ncbi:hypothetical protein ACHWQZ_G010001 [Mnemiopsis leidyi]
MDKLVLVLLLCSAGLSRGNDDLGNLTDALESFHERLRMLPEDMFEIQVDLGKFAASEEIKEQAVDLAQEIRSSLNDLASDVYNLRFLVDMLSEHEKGNEEEECSSWYLGMNLNPSDGHIMGYETGWSDDTSIGSQEGALIRDYLNQTVWNMPAKYIAIVRHHQGKLDAVKVFTFKHWGLSLSHRFKDTDPGRNIVTEGGPVFEYSVPGHHCKKVVWRGADVDDDNTHGFGNNFWVRPKMVEDPEASPEWTHEISNIQDCPLQGCAGVKGVKMQGTDYGSGSSLKSGPVYGNYAIYISDETPSFPTDGAILGINVNVCED